MVTRWRFVIFAAVLAIRLGSAGEINLRYLNFGDDVPSEGLVVAAAVDGGGNLFTVSSVAKLSGNTVMRLFKIDSQGATLSSLDIEIGDTSLNSAVAAATDPQGNLIITGVIQAPGFFTVAPLFPAVTGSGAFVMKLDANLNGIIFSTLLSNGSSAGAVATDSMGNIYVGGTTSSSDFPITPGAYQSKPPGTNSTYGGQTSYAFLSEISPNGDKLLYSTYFGGDTVNCPSDPSTCIGIAAATGVSALAIAPSGAIVIAGSTSATELLAIPLVVSSTCYSANTYPAGYIVSFAHGAKEVNWQTCVGTTQLFNYSQPPTQVNTLAVDGTGNVFLAGNVTGGTLPTTPGVLQAALPPENQLVNAGFVAKLGDAGGLLWSTYFGGTIDQEKGVNSVAVDSLGRVSITGYSDPGLLPAPATLPLFGDVYAARVSSDGTSLDDIYDGPTYATGSAIGLAPGGTFITAGQHGSLWIESELAGPSLLGTINAAGGLVTNLVSPSELVSLFGIGIGPKTAMPGEVQSGAFTTSLSGYRVLFDGTPAPLLYAGPTQINTIVPNEVAGQDTTHLQIVSPSGTIDGPALALRQAQPQPFTNYQSGLAAALNEDGTANSQQNPAKPGSIVSVFSTGNGVAAGADGQILTQPGLGNALPVAVLTGVTSLEILYSGNAPNLVAGVFQINFRLPVLLEPGGLFQFQLLVDGAISDIASIAVSQ